MGGLELANAYGELIDPQIQRARFRQFAETRRKMNLADIPNRPHFWKRLTRAFLPVPEPLSVSIVS